MSEVTPLHHVAKIRNGRHKFSTSTRHTSAATDVTRLYLSEIGRASLLTAKQERELARGVQAGCEADRQRMRLDVHLFGRGRCQK